ncbi:hypothetical protein BDQ17DRAFT_829264 [Cyathus striatus]|nr:hypothetical protein BDQ17DRAFT_829264 [Cyathus striatus]
MNSPLLAIPTDILDSILFQVSHLPQSSTQTLSSCSLSSKFLLIPSQRLLFHTVDLSCNHKHQSTQLEYLLAQNPTLGTYVRELIISERVSRGHFRLLTHGSRMARILRAMEGLQVLVLRTYEGMMLWREFSEPLKKAFVELFRGGHLHTLTICNMEGLPLGAVMGSAGVRRMVFDNVTVQADENEGFKSVSSKDITRPMSVDFSRAQDVAQGFLKAARNPDIPFSLSQLSSMRFAPTLKVEILAMRPILAAYGKYDEFTELEYSLTSCKDLLYMIDDIIRLDTLPYLRNLTLLIDPHFFLLPRNLHELATSLSSASPTNSINTLTIIIEALPFVSKSSRGQIHDADWGCIDKALIEGGRYGYLREVRVRVKLRKNPGWSLRSVRTEAVEEWEAALRGSLSRKMRLCEGAGIRLSVRVFA